MKLRARHSVYDAYAGPVRYNKLLPGWIKDDCIDRVRHRQQMRMPRVDIHNINLRHV